MDYEEKERISLAFTLLPLANQGCGSGSTWIRIHFPSWVRIRIRIKWMRIHSPVANDYFSSLGNHLIKKTIIECRIAHLHFVFICPLNEKQNRLFSKRRVIRHPCSWLLHLVAAVANTIFETHCKNVKISIIFTLRH